MKRKTILLIIFTVLLMSTLLATTALAGDAAPELDTLEPGGFLRIEQDLDINVVFIGFADDDIDQGAIEAALPGEYNVINRYPAFYGNTQFLGNDFDFTHSFPRYLE